MFSIIQAAGWPIWPLIICSIIALALVIERFSSLRAARVAPPRLLEEVLSEIPGVQEAAVTHVADPLLGQAVKAVIVRIEGDSPDALAVRAHCRARLAAYKVPKEIEFVKSLPRTSSGKVQRFKLV